MSDRWFIKSHIFSMFWKNCIKESLSYSYQRELILTMFYTVHKNKYTGILSKIKMLQKEIKNTKNPITKLNFTRELNKVIFEKKEYQELFDTMKQIAIVDNMSKELIDHLVI